MLGLGWEKFPKLKTPSGNRAERGGDHECLVAADQMSGLPVHAPLLLSVVDELIQVKVVGGHGAFGRAQNRVVRTLAVQQLGVGQRDKVLLLEGGWDVVNLEGLKELGAHLVAVDVEDAFVSHDGELKEAIVLPVADIGVNLKGVDRIGTLDEAAADNKAALEVPNRQVILSMNA